MHSNSINESDQIKTQARALGIGIGVNFQAPIREGGDAVESPLDYA
jgi:hypothetical protein